MRNALLAGVLALGSCGGALRGTSAQPGDVAVTVFWKNRSANLELSCGPEIRIGTIAETVVRANTGSGPGASFKLPAGSGRIGFMADDPKRVRSKWRWLSHDYACAPDASLEIHVETHDPGGLERIAVEVSYAGEGCRVPLHAGCCSDGPREPAD
jgi:hypothetical protein